MGTIEIRWNGRVYRKPSADLDDVLDRAEDRFLAKWTPADDLRWIEHQKRHPAPKQKPSNVLKFRR